MATGSFSGAKSQVLAVLGSPEFDALAAGCKAAPLHELMCAGFPVPNALVVPPEVETRHLRDQLETAITQIGNFPLAARSSSQLEDLAGASFAGQYVTRLGLTNMEQLLEGIDACRASARSPQVLSYLHKNGLRESDARVSVLVQKMVAVSIAGVAFSVHPTTGREEHALVECCHGLGERLVSGLTVPTQYVMQLQNSAVVERNPGQEDATLDDGVLKELCRYILELQAFFGRPQDIEWALDTNGRLWILQSRPITRIQWRSDIEEFTNADFRDGGVSARVCTPLMYSLYRDCFQRSMQQYFIDLKLLPRRATQVTWIAMFYGRPYWSATAVKNALLKVPGFDEQTFDRDLGIQKKYGESGPARTPTSLRTILPAIPVAIALEQNYRKQLRFTENYGRQFLTQEAHYLQLASSFPDLNDEGFFQRLGEVLNLHLKTESDYFTTIYNSTNYQSDFKKLLGKIAAATGEQISSVALMSGLQDVSHMKMQRGFVKLVAVAKQSGIPSSAWEKALADFLSTNYFHGDSELDISVPRWGEDPQRVVQIAEDILRSGIDPKDPDSSAKDQFEQFSAEERRIAAAIRRSALRKLKFAGPFRKQLKTARLYLSRREEMREYSTRVYNLVRRYILEAGARFQRRNYLKSANDIFMLDTEEIRTVIRGGKDSLAAAAEFRNLMYRGYRLVEPPGELGRAVTQRVHADAMDTSAGDLVLRGIGCSAGVITAPVRVVPSLHEANALQRGEILVTRFTDPGWTPVLGLVTGIITEVGGLLSHAAVIGREYGLPAVLNVPGATQILKTGQQVQIDGTEGTVKIIQSGKL